MFQSSLRSWPMGHRLASRLIRSVSRSIPKSYPMSAAMWMKASTSFGKHEPP